MIKKSLLIFIIAILIILGFSACTKSNDQGSNTKQQTQKANAESEDANILTVPESGYPIGNMEDSYPNGEYLSPEDKYPVQDSNRKNGPSFTIDEPIKQNKNIVTGTGPAGVPIRLVDITMMGEELGLTIIDENANFLFDLNQPLISGHVIGLMIGDLSKTEFNYDEFVYSNEYIDKPMIGTLFYVAVVP